MPKIVIVGGGFAGCAAAAAAARTGASVTLLERMDVLGGCGIVAGLLRDLFYPIREELQLMGAYDIFQVTDNCTIHEDVFYPTPPRVYKMFDASKIDSELRKHLEDLGVEVLFQSRAKDVEMEGKEIQAVILDDGAKIQGDVFLDATGGAGPEANCQKYGNGCVMCFHRCPAFGGRVSIAAKAGVKELIGKTPNGSFGPMSAACCLLKESIAPELRIEMERVGYVSVPVPPHLISEEAYKRNERITMSANIAKAFAENVVLMDIGLYAKRLANGYTPLEELRKVPGFERARYTDPYAATLGNAIRYMALTPRGDALNVPGVDNLFVASEKLGVVGLGEAIVGGVVAGHNAVRKAVGMDPMVLPKTTLIGYFLSYVNERWNTEKGLRFRANLQAEEGPFFSQASELGLYTRDKSIRRSRIEEAGLMGVLSEKIAR